MIKVSFIVPIYNVELYLDRCIQSLLCQDLGMEEYEIILINDGSTDRSVVIAQKYAETYENIQLYTQENRGLSEARNTGLKKVSGEYIVFVDSDDCVEANVIRRMYEICRSERLDILISATRILDKNGDVVSITPPSIGTDNVVDGNWAILHGLDIGCVWKNMYSNNFLKEKKLRFTPNIVHEDVDFNMLAYAMAKRIMGTEIISYAYFWNPLSLSRENSVEKNIKKIKDDIYIATKLSSIEDFAKIDQSIVSFYKKKSNSMVISLVLQLLCDKQLTSRQKKDILCYLKKSKCYPLKGTSESIKTTLLIPFTNIIISLVKADMGR